MKSLAWQTPEQFTELLALIRSLGDQVKMVTLREPPGIQWQDLIDLGYLHHPPVNPLNGHSLVVTDASKGPAGWLWVLPGDGKCDLYAIDSSGTEQFDESPVAAPPTSPPPPPPGGPPPPKSPPKGGGKKPPSKMA